MSLVASAPHVIEAFDAFLHHIELTPPRVALSLRHEFIGEPFSGA